MLKITQEHRYQIEYFALSAVLGLFTLIQPDRASRWGGWLARQIGPRLGIHRLAQKNLQAALPGKTPEDYDAILKGMWDHLGRMVAEFPDLEFLIHDLEIAGVEHLQNAYAKQSQVILFSGHIGNWEIMAPTLLRQRIPVDLVYRAPNNPYVARLLDKYRSLNGRLKLLPKSRSGTRQMVESIRTGRSIGILIDQKYNEGIETLFFGRPAMTSPAFVLMGQKYGCPVVPFRVERIEGIRFRLSFYPPLVLVNESGADRPAADVIDDAHTLLESWIAERPDQWLWIHHRWKKDS